jgi:hypothetical protein
LTRWHVVKGAVCLSRGRGSTACCPSLSPWVGLIHFQVSGLGRQVSGLAVQVQVQVPGLTPVPEDLNLGPEARDPALENDESVRRNLVLGAGLVTFTPGF